MPLFIEGQGCKDDCIPSGGCHGEWSWWLRDVTKMLQRPFLVRDAAKRSVLVVNDLIGVRRRVRGCIDVHCSFAGVGIGEGVGRHGDDLPLCQLLQFCVGISDPRVGNFHPWRNFVVQPQWKSSSFELGSKSPWNGVRGVLAVLGRLTITTCCTLSAPSSPRPCSFLFQPSWMAVVNFRDDVQGVALGANMSLIN